MSQRRMQHSLLPGIAIPTF